MEVVANALSAVLIVMTIWSLSSVTMVYFSLTKKSYITDRNAELLPNFGNLVEYLTDPAELAYMFIVGLLVTFYPSKWSFALLGLIGVGILYSCILGQILKSRAWKQ